MRYLRRFWCWLWGHELAEVTHTLQVIELKKRLISSSDCRRCGAWAYSAVEVSIRDEMRALSGDVFWADVKRASTDAVLEQAYVNSVFGGWLRARRIRREAMRLSGVGR